VDIFVFVLYGRLKNPRPLDEGLVVACLSRRFDGSCERLRPGQERLFNLEVEVVPDSWIKKKAHMDR